MGQIEDFEAAKKKSQALGAEVSITFGFWVLFLRP